ncbi:MAG: excinuclease ABC subunit UvrA [Deltaproteobacteria bacterium]|nr:excinuclease ABC subunit UvrA [Deltaproteobacteria bacterium]
MEPQEIIVKGARQHNLKNIDVHIPRNKLVVITGLSGSGKSSLAFDTIYAEGQRRYVESLSSYARQFLEQMGKPDVDTIEGLSPAISIEQKSTSRNPRSTVGTVTEIYDYLRLLFARVGHPHCYQCGKLIAAQTVSQMVDQILRQPAGTKLHLLAPVIRDRKGEYSKELQKFKTEGFVRMKIDGKTYSFEELPKLDKKKKHSIDLFIDRLVMKEGIQTRLADSLETALKYGEGLVKVEVVGDSSPHPSPLPQGARGNRIPSPSRGEGKGEGGNLELLFSSNFACIACGVSYSEIEPRLFSFNSPHGACSECAGLGHKMYFDPELVVPNPQLSINEGAIAPWYSKTGKGNYYENYLVALSKHYKFSLNSPWNKLPKKIQEILLNGSEEKISMGYYRASFEGVCNNLSRRYKETESDWMREELERYMNFQACPLCAGSRLKKEALAVKVAGKNIYEVTQMSVKECLEFFEGLQNNSPNSLPPPDPLLTKEGEKSSSPLLRKERVRVRSEYLLSTQEFEIASRILKEIRERLSFLSNVGLDYLSLDRTSGTLSGGEAQRIRLATQIGSSLVGVLYILDEPSIGLHQRDNSKLLATLKRLRDLGNTVLVVEHDEETILESDHVIDMGPGAGVHGGEIIAQGRPEDICKNPNSLTGLFISGKEKIALPAVRRKAKGKITLKGCRENNLKNITVDLPLGVFTCITGVSGSGKSTLINDTFYKALAQQLHGTRETAGKHDEMIGLDQVDKIINIDQSPIGRTPRSNPATYTGLFTPIRDLFAALPEAKVRGYKAGRFSFNVKGGRCEACEGDGLIKIEMHFLPDIYVQCEECKGLRYNRETLEIKFKGHSIADLLKMSVEKALELLAAIPSVASKLKTLVEVGLSYIELGQAATTLSGGEAQRIKLAKELSKRSTGKTLYILDEPTTGLHFADIQKLLEVLHRFVEGGNSVLVIEHNLDVIKTADWIIDLGPEGGSGGGEIIGQGTPEELAALKHSYTGQYLKRYLGGMDTAKKRA